MIWAGHVTSMEEIRDAFKLTIGRLEGHRPLRNLHADWRQALMNTVMKIRIP